MNNQWTHKGATVGQKRLRLGVGGPSRSGKTYSSLRIATGISRAIGKPIFVIDTDNEFALDYAGDFQFQHVDFPPPYTSERYQSAIEYCVAQDAGVIVIDQMTSEHTGEGGMLERQEKLTEELAAKWHVAREKATWAAWAQAKAPHGKLVSYITRVKQPMIFNFRAKDKLKLIKNQQGKQEPVHMGYTPICAEQFDYEMTAMLILPENSEGMPDKALSEIRKPLRPIIRLGEQIDESLGTRLAEWALGSGAEKAPAPKVPVSVSAGVGEGRSEHTIDHSSSATSSTAGAPDDASIVKDIEQWVKRKKFDMAYDLARSIADESLRKSTIERIDKAKEYVEAKH